MPTSIRETALSLALVALFAPPARAADPAAKYPYALPPLEIRQRLADLRVGTAPPLPAEEQNLLAKAWALKVETKFAAVAAEDALLVDGVLFASGVEDETRRARYREQLDALTASAREATAPAKTAAQRGDLLLKHLHATAMKAGYEETQSSLAALFDTGKYNCVSSAVLYYLVGSRLGLELRGISIPGDQWRAGHATIDLIDGRERIQVEATNADGFDWAAKLRRPGVVPVGFTPDRKAGREVDGLGLAAMIYSNRGVAHGKEDPARPLEAACCNLASLALSPTDPTGVHNLHATFINWGAKLADDGKHEEGLRVLALGLAFSPGPGPLADNRSATFRRWSESLLKKRDYEGSLAALARGYRLDPKDGEIHKGVEYHTQEALPLAAEKGGTAAVKEHHQAVRGQFPDVAGVAGIGASYVRREAAGLAEKQKFAEALKLADEYTPALLTREGLAEIGGDVYDRWARSLEAGGKLDPVLGKYAEGLKRYPGNGRLSNNAVATVDSWAGKAMDAGDWDKAIATYATGLRYLPDSEHLKHNKAYCEQKKAKK